MNEVTEQREFVDEEVFDKAFIVDGITELCHYTGYMAKIFGEWYNEYEDSNGDLHYGR